MRYIGILAINLLISSPAFADMATDEGCQAEGNVAKKASEMRIGGVSQDTATNTLIRINNSSKTVLPENRIRGLVMVSYMAKMKPDKMHVYAIDQCNKNKLK